MSGIIGKKIGMTSMYDENGKLLPCTIIQAGPCVVTQVKNKETDGYEAIQLGYDDKKVKNTPKALQGHFEKAKTSPKKKVVEFRKFRLEFEGDAPLGKEVKAEEVFDEGDFVDAIGTSKGKGFQGVVKRHNFSGVGDRTHGQADQERMPGAIGACSFPSRVFKGMKMAGRTGGDRVKILNLKVLKLMPDNNLILVSGSVPGSKNSYIVLEK